MANAKGLVVKDGFAVQNGVIMRYMGHDSNVIVPDGITGIGDNAFPYCSGLKSIVLPDSVTSIGEKAFGGCSNLTSVTLPATLINIGDYAFENCKNLTNIEIPNDKTRIGEGAFCGCTGLADANGFVIVKGVLYSYHGQGESITVPEGVTRIGNGVFAGSVFKPSKVTSVTLPDSIISIGSRVFDYTLMIENKQNWEDGSLYLDNCLIKTDKAISGTFAIKEGTRCIAGDAFRDCRNLTAITIPDGVVSIGDAAFYGCIGLSDLRIPKSVAFIGKNAFPENIKTLDIDAYNFELPDGKLSAFAKTPSGELSVFAPNLPFSTLKQHGLGMAAVKSFISDHTRYTDAGRIRLYGHERRID